MEHKFTQWYLNLPKIVKILLALVPVFGGVYRFLRYLENKETMNLIVGIVWFITGGFCVVGLVIELIGIIKQGEPSILVA